MNIKKIYYEYDASTCTSTGVEYEKYLHQSQSKYQKIEVLKTKNYGNVLYLDGCFMLSEKNQDYYHNECINLVPKTSKNILILGGGDYGIASQLIKRKSIKNITIVEIDSKVVEISKKYFPNNFKQNNNEIKRIKLVQEDGMLFLSNNHIRFNCIIIDSTDPVGAAKVLFSKGFLNKCYLALSSHGVIIQQSGSPIKDMKKIIEPLTKRYLELKFKKIQLTSFPMPLYPTGTWSFVSAKRA